MPKRKCASATICGPLDALLKSRAIKPGALELETGRSRQYLLKIRKGIMEPTRPGLATIVRACRRLSGEPVTAGQLFDLGDNDGVRVEQIEHPEQMADAGA